MNERAQAVEILKRAQDLLSERLVEQVIESRDEILADALGLSHSSSIDAIYEQVGARLAHVNAMLQNLPPEPAATEGVTAEGASPQVEEPMRHSSLLLALPAPRSTIAGLLPMRPSVSFQAFTHHIGRGDLRAAGETLAALFDVEFERGLGCAQIFQQRFAQQPEMLSRALQLPTTVQVDHAHVALMILSQCFGLQGLELVSVMERLRSRAG